MEISSEKFSFYKGASSTDMDSHMAQVFPFKKEDLDSGLIYLSFLLKPNRYCSKDCEWLIKKMD